METLFLAVVAALVLGRLYMVLGQNNGAKPPVFPKDMIKLPDDLNVKPDDNTALNNPNINIENTPFPINEKWKDMAEAIAHLRNKEPNFDPMVFEDSAAHAYEAIITYYSLGDEKNLAPLVTKNVLESYKIGMEERAKQNSGKIEIIKLLEPIIKSINIKDNIAHIDVLFEATLVEMQKKPRSNQRNLDF